MKEGCITLKLTHDEGKEVEYRCSHNGSCKTAFSAREQVYHQEYARHHPKRGGSDESRIVGVTCSGYAGKERSNAQGEDPDACLIDASARGCQVRLGNALEGHSDSGVLNPIENKERKQSHNQKEIVVRHLRKTE